MNKAMECFQTSLSVIPSFDNSVHFEFRVLKLVLFGADPLLDGP